MCKSCGFGVQHLDICKNHIHSHTHIENTNTPLQLELYLVEELEFCSLSHPDLSSFITELKTMIYRTKLSLLDLFLFSQIIPDAAANFSVQSSK